MVTPTELIKHRFANELRRCCGSHYKSVPSNEQFARDLYLSSTYVLKVSRETVRKWFKGESFPDLDHLLHLIKWLKLDMTNIFVVELQLEKNNVLSPQLKFLEINSIDQITPDQIDSIVRLLNSIKNSDLVKRPRS